MSMGSRRFASSRSMSATEEADLAGKIHVCERLRGTHKRPGVIREPAPAGSGRGAFSAGYAAGCGEVFEGLGLTVLATHFPVFKIPAEV